MCVCALLFAVVVTTSPPPLPLMTDSQRDRLSHTNDGGDHQEEAFLAVLEHVRGWKENAVASLSFAPANSFSTLAALEQKPSQHRGEWFVVRGLLQQRSPLGPSFDGVAEWFVRDSYGKAMLVYVVNAEARASSWRDGQEVIVPALFYKTVNAVARDGLVHQYPAFIGAYPRLAASVSPAPPGAMNAIWIIVPLVGAMIVAYVLLRLWIRRKTAGVHRCSQRVRPAKRDWPAQVDDGVTLPDDPAAALAELKRRAAENT